MKTTLLVMILAVARALAVPLNPTQGIFNTLAYNIDPANILFQIFLPEVNCPKCLF